MSKIALMIDFGSTYSQFTAVDVDSVKILGQVTLPTNSQENLMKCYSLGKEKILQMIDVDQPLEEYFCSSAWGGFRMIAIGLTETLTAEAAKRAALGAGTRILKTYSYRLKPEQVEEINLADPDVILLTGGTDGGNHDIICDNAQILNDKLHHGVILYAGNKDAVDKMKQIFTNRNITVYYTENVMPSVNVLNAVPVRTIAQEIFMKKIIQTKGISDVAKNSSLPVIPTPTAVLKAAQLLADGYKEQTGIGPLVILDIGGATTDVHSVGDGLPTTDDTFFEGLEEPYLKRTVEGDLGMRSSAQSLVKSKGLEKFKEQLGSDWTDEKIEQACQIRINNADYIAKTPSEKYFDNNLASVACDFATNRHAGRMRKQHSLNRIIYYQTGKDLRKFKTIIGTGGVIVHNDAPQRILKEAFQTDTKVLKPVDPTCLVDKHYIISTLGILAQKYPKQALQLLKENLI